jgi:hypothetical protein
MARVTSAAVVFSVVSLICMLQARACDIGTDDNPASSCRAVKECNPLAKSKLYVIGTPGRTQRLFCDMKTVRCGIRGGWTRIADVDMSFNGYCPYGLETFTHGGKRLCRRGTTSPGCSSTFFNTRKIPFSKVCGRVAAYGCKTLDSFRYYKISQTIDDAYMDGISITHGPTNNRKHVYTFAADYSRFSSSPVPFVGNNWITDLIYPHECFSTKLFDGQSCRFKHSCSVSGQPFFCLTVATEVKEQIELRLCRDSDRGNEDVALGEVELFIY